MGSKPVEDGIRLNLECLTKGGVGWKLEEDERLRNLKHPYIYIYIFEEVYGI